LLCFVLFAASAVAELTQDEKEAYSRCGCSACPCGRVTHIHAAPLDGVDLTGYRGTPTGLHADEQSVSPYMTGLVRPMLISRGIGSAFTTSPFAARLVPAAGVLPPMAVVTLAATTVSVLGPGAPSSSPTGGLYFISATFGSRRHPIFVPAGWQETSEARGVSVYLDLENPSRQIAVPSTFQLAGSVANGQMFVNPDEPSTKIFVPSSYKLSAAGGIEYMNPLSSSERVYVPPNFIRIHHSPCPADGKGGKSYVDSNGRSIFVPCSYRQSVVATGFYAFADPANPATQIIVARSHVPIKTQDGGIKFVNPNTRRSVYVPRDYIRLSDGGRLFVLPSRPKQKIYVPGEFVDVVEGPVPAPASTSSK